LPEEWDHQKTVDRFAPEHSQVDLSQRPAVLIAAAPALHGPVLKPPDPPSTKQVTPPKKPVIEPLKPPKAPVPPTLKKEDAEKKHAKSSSSGSKERSYVVLEGDSLWKIARLFGVKIEDIRKLNGIQTDTLQPGMALKIPSGKEKKS